MNINAAMPAMTLQSYTGTAAATDIANGKVTDFSGELGNFIQSEQTMQNAQTVAQQTEIQNADAEVTPEAVEIIASDMELTQELSEKYAGYMHSEILAMLTAHSNSDELQQILEFNVEAETAVQGVENEGKIQTIEVTDIMPDIDDMPIPETKEADIVSIQPSGTKKDGTDGIQLPVTEEKNDGSIQIPEIEETDVAGVQPSETSEADIPDMMLPDTEKTDIPVFTEEVKTAVTEKISTYSLAEGGYENPAESPVISVVDSNVDNLQLTSVHTDTTIVQKAQVTATGENAAATHKSVENPNGEKPVTVDNSLSEVSETLTATKGKISAVEVTETQVSGITEQSDEQVQENFGFERHFSGRRIESRSEEAQQLAKSISGTKSESDLEVTEKVTVKTDSADTAENLLTGKEFSQNLTVNEQPAEKSEAPVRMTVSETYTLISEKAGNEGRQTFTVELNPETLGKITVRMVNEGGKLSVEILTETDAAKQLFNEKATELAYNLKQNDVEIQSYRVETDDTQLFNESFDGSSKNPYRESKQTAEAPEDYDEFERLFDEIVNMQ